MGFEASQKNWDQLAKEDAFWAILTDPSKKHGRWQPEEFFQTGVAEINRVMDDLAKQGLTPGKDRALDFGCGTGRLSQALAAWFKEVHGVDVSSSMIELANRFNKQPDRCHYHLNANGHLRRFPDGHFDFSIPSSRSNTSNLSSRNNTSASFSGSSSQAVSRCFNC